MSFFNPPQYTTLTVRRVVQDTAALARAVADAAGAAPVSVTQRGREIDLRFEVSLTEEQVQLAVEASRGYEEPPDAPPPPPTPPVSADSASLRSLSVSDATTLTGAFSLSNAGLRVSPGGVTLGQGDLLVLRGDAAVASGSLAVQGDVTVGSGGVAVALGGVDLARGDLTLAEGSLAVAGSARVLSGLEVSGGVAVSGAAGVSGGLSVLDGGLSVLDGGLSVALGGIDVAQGGLSVLDGGLSVLDGGLSVALGGIDVAQGGLVLALGGISASGAATIGAGLEVAAGIDVVSGDVSVGAGGLAVAGPASIGAGIDVAGGASIHGGAEVATGGLVVSGGAEVASGDAAVTAGDLGVSGDVAVGGRVLVGGVRIPDAFPGAVVTPVDDAGDSLRYAAVSTDTPGPTGLALASFGPPAGGLAAAPAFAPSPGGCVRVYSAPATHASRGGQGGSSAVFSAGAGPLLVLFRSVTAQVDFGDEAELAGGALVDDLPAGVLCHSSHLRDEPSAPRQATWSAYCAPGGAQPTALRHGTFFSQAPASGSYLADEDTRLVALRLPEGTAAFHGQTVDGSLELSLQAPAALPFQETAAASGVAPLASGFVATAPGTYLLAGCFTGADSPRTRHDVELNGAPLYGVSLYAPYSTGSATASAAFVATLGAGDEVTVSSRRYQNTGRQPDRGRLTGNSLTAAAVPVDDCVQFSGAYAFGAYELPGNQVAAIPLGQPDVAGGSFSLAGGVLTIERPGHYLFFGCVSAADPRQRNRELSPRRSSLAQARALFGGGTVAMTAQTLVGSNQVTMSFAGEREATPGTTVALQALCEDDASLLGFSLCLVRVDSSEYPPRARSPLPLAVRGSFYRRSMLPTRMFGLATDFHPAISLNTGPVPAGQYCADIFLVARAEDQDSGVLCRVRVDGDEAVAQDSPLPAGPGGGGTVCRRVFFLLAEGPHSVDLDVSRRGPPGVELPDGSLEVYRVA